MTLDAVTARPELTFVDGPPAFYVDVIKADVDILAARPVPRGTASSNDRSEKLVVLDPTDRETLDAAAFRYGTHSSRAQRVGETVVLTARGVYSHGVDDEDEVREPVALANDVTAEVTYGGPSRPTAARVVFHTRTDGHRILWVWDRGPGSDLLSRIAESVAFAELRGKLRDA